MWSRIKRVLFFAVFALLAGCAGKDFVRPAPETFKLGQSTYDQVTGQLGEPRSSGQTLKNEKRILTINYAFATVGGEPLEAGVTPVRGLNYFFHDNILVGQQFLSSFKSDHSNFDDSKLTEIVKDKTSRAEVLSLLGKPTASFIYPMVKQKTGEAIGYTYTTVTRGGGFGRMKMFVKSALISFDEKDVVTEVEFSTSGTE